MNCRHCSSILTLAMIDLGSAPHSNAYLTSFTLSKPEKWFPLKVLICNNCWLAQTEDTNSAEDLFDADYAYFSSYSNSWLKHAERYVSEIQPRFNLNSNSFVVEVAANDGYLLQYVKQRGISCLGIEPTSSTARASREKGIPVIEKFFGSSLANELKSQNKQADLIVANNVLAHVPEINDFVKGFAILLKPFGIATFEFTHLMRLIEKNLFDTIYHEHFSYLSLTSVIKIFNQNGLAVFDVEELSTQGGSLRVYAQRKDTGIQKINNSVTKMLTLENAIGMSSMAYYESFQNRSIEIKNNFLDFLIDAKKRGKIVVGYGAAAKGNTLINYAGIRTDLLHWVVDKNPEKIGKFLPGSRIPIVNENNLKSKKPDYVVILPWNLKAEIIQQLDYIKAWGGKFVTAIPTMEIN